jgi:hypothetical protein
MTELPMIDAERPWPGLLPFTEDARSFFHGRETETDDLFRLIEREPLTVLFGQSGLGKSSLLNAGVFPCLRRAGYLPVYLRLNLDAAAPTLIEQVWSALISECVDYEVNATAPMPGDSLWQYLHRPGTRFLNPHGRPVMPVLIFDQFEEIFTLGRQTPEQMERTQVLLNQLGELIENRLPPALESELTEHPELLDQFDLLRQNIKTVFTFREDHLADFEGLKVHIRPIMQNRMRLTPMRGDRAAKAIRQVGTGRLSEAVAARIVRFVGRAEAGQLEEISVEPALLSLVCRELNEQRIARGQQEISADLIQGENTQQIIAQFYNQGFAGLDVRVRYFVEDRLLTTAGYRDSCALENALAEPGVSEAAIQSLVDRRILRREERGGLVRLELIHDVLAIVAKGSRDARREAAALEAARLELAAHRRHQRIVAAWAAVLLAGLVGVSWLALVASRGERSAVAAKQQALGAQARADQQAKSADEQKKIAQGEAVRANAAEQASNAKKVLLDQALKTADAATAKAKSEAVKKEEERRKAVTWAAAADEQLDNRGTGVQLRACIDSTNRLSNDPPPSASLDYMVGVWHVDQDVSTSTDMEWRPDGKCQYRHLYLKGQEIDAKKMVCTWTYKPIAEHEFEVDYRSELEGMDSPRSLMFDIVSPTRMRNINIGYDAFRILCPDKELTIRQSELSALQKQADADPSNLKRQADLASGFDKLGVALAAQNDSAGALVEFNKELTIYMNLERADPGNLTWQRNVAQSWGQISDQHYAQSQAADQAGNAAQALQQAAAAVASSQQSVAIRQQLVHAAPEDVDAQLNAAGAFSQFAIALHWDNQNAKATGTQRQAVRLLEDIVDARHATPSVRLQLVQNLYTLSQLTDDANEKRDALRKSLAIAMELARQNEDTEETNSWIAELQGALAKLH